MFCTETLVEPGSHEAHLHWQKPKSKTPRFFGVPFTLPENP